METAAFALVYSVFGLLVGVGLGTMAMGFTLRRRFPALWMQLGEPIEWLSLQRTALGRHVFEFLDSRTYLKSDDPGFIRFCGVLRFGWYAFFVLFVIAIFVLGGALVSKQ
jgi:hypothetical protein